MPIIILVQCLSFHAWVWAEGHFNWCLWRVAVIVRFVFPRCIITEFVSHQSAASWRLALRVGVGAVSIHRMFFPLVWRGESSANYSLLTLSFDICSGRSLTKMQNRSGPSTEPWKTLNFTSSFDDDSFIRKIKQTYWVLFVRQDRNEGEWWRLFNIEWSLLKEDRVIYQIKSFFKVKKIRASNFWTINIWQPAAT